MTTRETPETIPLLTALDLVVGALRENDTTEGMSDLDVLAWFAEQWESGDEVEFQTAGLVDPPDADLLARAARTVARAFGLSLTS